MKKIGIFNGPNLDRLGIREPEIYGHQSLDDLRARMEKLAGELGLEIDFMQSNSESVLIEQLASWADAGFDGVIGNPAGLTHTSISLLDAIKGSGLPYVEVHISNVYHRGERQKCLTAEASTGIIMGLGFAGYDAALRFLAEK
ncbi:MAG: type II 3-dehydroquinate dehydratase [Verrucomicrobiota bacterium]